MRTFLLALAMAGLAVSAVAETPVKVKFTKRQLDPKFRSEGVAYGDFNNDGKLDIASPSNAAPSGVTSERSNVFVDSSAIDRYAFANSRPRWMASSIVPTM